MMQYPRPHIRGEHLAGLRIVSNKSVGGRLKASGIDGVEDIRAILLPVEFKLHLISRPALIAPGRHIRFDNISYRDHHAVIHMKVRDRDRSVTVVEIAVVEVTVVAIGVPGVVSPVTETGPDIGTASSAFPCGKYK